MPGPSGASPPGERRNANSGKSSSDARTLLLTIGMGPARPRPIRYVLIGGYCGGYVSDYYFGV